MRRLTTTAKKTARSGQDSILLKTNSQLESATANLPTTWALTLTSDGRMSFSGNRISDHGMYQSSAYWMRRSVTKFLRSRRSLNSEEQTSQERITERTLVVLSLANNITSR